MGPAQGAVISGQLIKDIKDKEYLALVGAMGTMSVIFSLVTFYTLGKAKDGSIVALSKLIEVGLKEFIILLCAYMIAGSAAVFLALFLAKKFSKFITKINYKALVICIICFVMMMALILDGLTGLLILMTAAAIGLIAPLKEVARSHAMGCLLLPVTLFLLL
jgi:putative membrane protein